MKHASKQALDEIAELLQTIRLYPELKEKSYGVFYRKSKPFLHFHEDPAGMFADVMTGAEFQRLPVTAHTAREEFMKHLKTILRS